MTVKAFNTSDVPRFRRMVTAILEYIIHYTKVNDLFIRLFRLLRYSLFKCNEFKIFIIFISPLIRSKMYCS